MTLNYNQSDLRQVLTLFPVIIGLILRIKLAAVYVHPTNCIIYHYKPLIISCQEINVKYHNIIHKDTDVM